MVNLGSITSFRGTRKHSKAMFRTMMTSLIEHERIRTTVGKAKVLTPMINSLFYQAKRNTWQSKLKIQSLIRTKFAQQKLMTNLVRQYKY